MKNLFIGLGVLAMISATSCKKIYTCECTSTVDGISTTVAGDSEEKMSKSDAEAECEGASYSTTSGASTVSVSCELI